MINLTPHAIALADGTVIPSAGQARIAMEEEMVAAAGPDGQTAGVPVIVQRPGAVTGLPAEEAGVTYLVSQLVAASLPERRDLFFPARLVRDGEGRVAGCAALGQVPGPAKTAKAGAGQWFVESMRPGDGDCGRGPGSMSF